MLVLSTAEKISAYQFALDRIVSLHAQFIYAGVCGGLADWVVANYEKGYSPALLFFPEFAILRPENASAYWWSLDDEGQAERVRVLKQIISDLQNTAI